MKKKNLIIVSACILVVLVIVVISVFNKSNVTYDKNQPENPDTIAVTFYDENSIISDKQYVGTLDDVVYPEVNLNLPNKFFSYWDTEETHELNAYSYSPIYTDASDKANVFGLSSIYVTNEKDFELPFKVSGKVEFCGADLCLSYDKDYLEYKGISNTDSDVEINDDKEAGLIYIRVINARNINAEMDIAYLKFKAIKEAPFETKITIIPKEVKKISGEDIIDADVNIVDSTIIGY